MDEHGEMDEMENIGRPQYEGTIFEKGFTQIGNILFDDPEITPEALGLYLYYVKHLGPHSRGAFPSNEKTKKDLKIGRKAFYNARYILEKNGYLIVQERYSENGARTSNLHIAPILLSDIEKARDTFCKNEKIVETDPHVKKSIGIKSDITDDESIEIPIQSIGQKEHIPHAEKSMTPMLKRAQEQYPINNTQINNLSCLNNNKEIAATEDELTEEEKGFRECQRAWENIKNREINRYEVPILFEMIKKASPKLIKIAMNEAMINNPTARLNYVLGIINNWVEKEITDIDGVEQEKQDYQNRKIRNARLDNKILDLREENAEVWEKEIDQRKARIKQIDKDQKKKSSTSEYEIYVPKDWQENKYYGD